MPLKRHNLTLKRRCKTSILFVLFFQIYFLWCFYTERRLPSSIRAAECDRSETRERYATSMESLNSNTDIYPTTKPSIDMHNDYYPFYDFRFVFPEISPELQKTSDIFMIVLVNSGAKGDKFRKRREVIRQTWGNRSNCEQLEASRGGKINRLRWLLVFLVGKAGQGTNDDELNVAEARQHNDMLIGNITDNYVSNTIKLFMGLVWASRFDINYAMKADDDVYVRIPRLLQYLVNAKFPKPFYGGEPCSHCLLTVSRKIGYKWAISWKYYGRKEWPIFNSGAFFILSNDLFNRLFAHVYKRKPFHIDDAYIGVALWDLGVNATGIPSFTVRRNMAKRVRKLKDVDLLRLDAIGHGMDPQSIKYLHNRFETLAC